MSHDKEVKSMGKVAEYRYVKRRFKNEKQFNIHVREMIAVLKNEEVKQNLYVRGIKLSNHAFERMQQHFGVNNIATATRMVKDMLSKAVRIGTVLAYDGRINVLYAYQQIAIFLSPDLKTVVTINKYTDVTYNPIRNKVDNCIDKDKLIKLHLERLKQIEEEEQEYINRILSLEEKVRKEIGKCVSLMRMSRRYDTKKHVKSLISNLNHKLKKEGWKLFNLKVQKRHICKSLVALC
jgi:hypothetical protein